MNGQCGQAVLVYEALAPGILAVATGTLGSYWMLLFPKAHTIPPLSKNRARRSYILAIRASFSGLDVTPACPLLSVLGLGLAAYLHHLGPHVEDIQPVSEARVAVELGSPVAGGHAQLALPLLADVPHQLRLREVQQRQGYLYGWHRYVAAMCPLVELRQEPVGGGETLAVIHGEERLHWGRGVKMVWSQVWSPFLH